MKSKRPVEGIFLPQAFVFEWVLLCKVPIQKCCNLSSGANSFWRKRTGTCSCCDAICNGPAYSRREGSVRRYVCKGRRLLWQRAARSLPHVHYGHCTAAGGICVEGWTGYHALFIGPYCCLPVALRYLICEGTLNRWFRLAAGAPKEGQNLGISAILIRSELAVSHPLRDIIPDSPCYGSSEVVCGGYIGKGGSSNRSWSI